MIVPGTIRRKFLNLNDFVRHVGDKVRDVLFAFCESKGYAFVSRFKTVESVAEKIESGRYAAWSALDDLYAATIVIPTLADEEDVLTFLRSRFQEVTTKMRGAGKKAPDVFRYDATRFIGKLRNDGPTDRAPEITDMMFEVQIRTAFEHAWSVTTHALAYKSPVVDWRRLRLAAQLKAAVEQLDTLVLAFEESAPRIVESKWADIASQQQISTSFQGWVAEGVIPDDLKPKDWSRFSENVHKALRAGLKKEPKEPRVSPNDTERALNAVERELKAMGAAKVPLSISLFQLTLGILAQQDLLNYTFREFTINVTDELCILFPAMKRLKPLFDYEDGFGGA